MGVILVEIAEAEKVLDPLGLAVPHSGSHVCVFNIPTRKTYEIAVSLEM